MVAVGYTAIGLFEPEMTKAGMPATRAVPAIHPAIAGVVGPVASVEGLPTQTLLAQAEPFDQLAISLGIPVFQVVEELAAAADHLQQATAGVMILAMFLEVAGQAVDARGQERDLDFGRPRVALGALIIGNDLRLGCVVESHMRLLLSSSVRQETANYTCREKGIQGFSPASG